MAFGLALGIGSAAWFANGPALAETEDWGQSPGQEGGVLRVMTFNIRHGEGLDGRVDLARVATVIKEVAPDLVGLQEVDQNWSFRSQFVEQAAWLARELGMEFAFAPALHRGSLLGADGGYGNALLSRYPILRSETIILPRLDTREDRSLLIAQVKVPNGLVQVGVTHLGLSSRERLQHVRVIREKLLTFGLPTILMGDWNARPDSPEVVAVTEWLASVTAGGMWPTFCYNSPDGKPNVQIDYIFASPEFKVAGVRTVPTDASDHWPLVAELQLSFGSVSAKGGEGKQAEGE
ncbi:MAG: endonuclease/exonuclease/phosphatase family protein [Limnochordales bacterium]|nr:endonuclease/exonuclease/phosphatase family protein [Limnochordales bacterium]